MSSFLLYSFLIVLLRYWWDVRFYEWFAGSVLLLARMRTGSAIRKACCYGIFAFVSATHLSAYEQHQIVQIKQQHSPRKQLHAVCGATSHYLSDPVRPSGILLCSPHTGLLFTLPKQNEASHTASIPLPGQSASVPLRPDQAGARSPQMHHRQGARKKERDHTARRWDKRLQSAGSPDLQRAEHISTLGRWARSSVRKQSRAQMPLP